MFSRRKLRSSTDAFFALSSAIQNKAAAARFTSVPPAATSRESYSLDHATAVRSPDCAPVRSAIAAWPSPSCKTDAIMAASTPMAQTVSVSSRAVAGRGRTSVEAMILFLRAAKFLDLAILGHYDYSGHADEEAMLDDAWRLA
jgi:hypothetical protein